MAITLVVHGGAGRIKPDVRPAYEEGLRAALSEGFARLRGGGSALEAAIAAVVVMENNPRAFNAGTGGSPNREGVVECDAAVMNGADRSSGAVAAITRARNPILVAEQVRRQTPHVLFAGAGADALVAEPIDNSLLLTERMRAALDDWRREHAEPSGSATVGAVALDEAGNLAAATSTGGVLGKWPGRVGDSPLVGAGTYADARAAVSCTGKGEAFIRGVSAKTLAMLVERGDSLRQSVRTVLADLPPLGGDGGLISVCADGRLCAGFNTPQMAFGWKTADTEEARVGLEPGLYGPA